MLKNRILNKQEDNSRLKPEEKALVLLACLSTGPWNVSGCFKKFTAGNGDF